MTISAMKEKKRELGLSNKQLSELSGVPEATLQKLFSGRTKSPRRDTVEALRRVLDTDSPNAQMAVSMHNAEPADLPERKRNGFPSPEAPSHYLPSSEQERPSQVSEGESVYRSRRFTLRDYLALPDDHRAELIDGVFYNMAAPSTLHQLISSLIQKCLLDHVMNSGGTCLPFSAPVDVVLDDRQDTVVQPDVLIVCDRDKLRDGRIYGAPDLVVEVLSPSTRRKDIGLKLYKYFEAGVREYWIVDPEPRQIAVFDMEHGGIISLYGPDTKTGLNVPVGIWEGKCIVDFESIFTFAEPLYQT